MLTRSKRTGKLDTSVFEYVDQKALRAASKRAKENKSVMQQTKKNSTQTKPQKTPIDPCRRHLYTSDCLYDRKCSVRYDEEGNFVSCNTTNPQDIWRLPRTRQKEKPARRVRQKPTYVEEGACKDYDQTLCEENKDKCMPIIVGKEFRKCLTKREKTEQQKKKDEAYRQMIKESKKKCSDITKRNACEIAGKNMDRCEWRGNKCHERKKHGRDRRKKQMYAEKPFYPKRLTKTQLEDMVTKCRAIDDKQKCPKKRGCVWSRKDKKCVVSSRPLRGFQNAKKTSKRKANNWKQPSTVEEWAVLKEKCAGIENRSDCGTADGCIWHPTEKTTEVTMKKKGVTTKVNRRIYACGVRSQRSSAGKGDSGSYKAIMEKRRQRYEAPKKGSKNYARYHDTCAKIEGGRKPCLKRVSCTWKKDKKCGIRSRSYNPEKKKKNE